MGDYGKSRFYNGNAPGTAKNFRRADIEWVTTMWTESGLDMWIPAPNQVLNLKLVLLVFLLTLLEATNPLAPF